MSEAPVKVGEVLAGKYTVERILGSGMMGVVVAARQIELDRRVALKFMTAGAAQLGREHERFMREARVAAKLQSQHVAKVLDVGTLAQGQPYIVMEYLDGKDLSAVLHERGRLPVEEAVFYVLQVAEALAEAHAAGIVHRDVKPANLFLTHSADGMPCVKLVDFGIAKMSDSGLHLTGTVQTLGSPLYMAPEAMKSGRMADARTDVWALGVTLYELLAGLHVTPFQATDIFALVQTVCFSPPIPLEQYRPDVPPGLAQVILQAVEKDLTRRFQTIAAFAAALAPYGPARQASYAERVALMQGTGVAPARPTDLLPAEPTPFPARPYPMSSSAGVSRSAVARSTVDPPPSLGSIGTPPLPQQGATRTLVLAGSVIVAGSLLSAALFFGLRARATGPEPAASASLETAATPTTPDASVAVEPAGPASASAQPPAPVASASSSGATAASGAPHAKTAAPIAPRHLTRPDDDVDSHFKAPRR